MRRFQLLIVMASGMFAVASMCIPCHAEEPVARSTRADEACCTGGTRLTDFDWCGGPIVVRNIPTSIPATPLSLVLGPVAMPATPVAPYLRQTPPIDPRPESGWYRRRPASVAAQAPAEPRNLPQPDNQQAMREISEIRERLGGTVLRGTIFDQVNARDHILTAGEVAVPAMPTGPFLPTTAPGAMTAPGVYPSAPPQPTFAPQYRTATERADSQCETPGVRTDPRATQRANSLRQASWQLEQTAHLLEMQTMYDRADALWDLSARLRRDAREIESGKGDADREQKPEQKPESADLD